MKSSTFSGQILVLALMSVVLLGCGENEKLSISQRSIIYCSEGSPETFNPQLVTSGTTIDATSNQLYNRLISYQGEDNIIGPALAKSWHVTRDGKMVTFYLRKDVSFHQTDYFTPTRNLNADDVLFSFNRIIDKTHPYNPISGGVYPFFQSVEFNNLVEQIEKINDHTIRFKLKHKDSTFLANLATDFAVILSAEYAEQLAKKNAHHEIDIFPIGTGPFKLKEYRVGSFIRYYRHNEYWQGKAKIEQLVFDITPSNTGRLTKLLANECDVTAYPIAHKTISQQSELRLDKVTSLNVGYIGFNTLKKPFDNKLVRQAISFAINKEALIETVYHGRAEAARSILPASSWAYDAKIVEQKYDINQAKTLLAQAGYGDGFTMDIWAMPVQRAYNPSAITMAKLIKADLKKINITVNIVDSYEWSTFLRRLTQGEHQTFLLGWSADHPDPDNFFTPMLSCSATKTGSNRTFWCHEEYNQIIQKALQTNTISQRKKYYSQAMKILAEEIPLLPIAHSKRYQARGFSVKGTILGAFGGVNFYQVSKQESINNESNDDNNDDENKIKVSNSDTTKAGES
ncbi:MAG: ABC transporter substrate-binding protein [Colwellia sp.]